MLIVQTAMRETTGVTRSADRMRASPPQDKSRPGPYPRDGPPYGNAASCDFGRPSASLRHRNPAPVSRHGACRRPTVGNQSTDNYFFTPLRGSYFG